MDPLETDRQYRPTPTWDGRILYMSSVDISRPNGPGVNEREFVLGLIQHLEDRVRILLPEPRFETPDLDTIRPHAVLTPPVPGKGLRRAWGPQMEQYRQALCLHRETPFDLVVTRLGQYPLGLYRFLRATGLPLAIKTLGIGIPDIPKAYPGLHGIAERTRRRIRRPVHRWLVRRLLRRALAVDACTPELIGQITHHLPVDPDRVFLVPNATNVDRFVPRDSMAARKEMGLADFGPILGYVGGQPSKKGGRAMIEAATRLMSDYPDLGVVIVGGDVEELRGLAEKRGIAGHVVLPGKVPYDEVPAYINTFDIGCVLMDAALEQTTGNDVQKIRQYLASGLPVIASPGGNGFLEEQGLGTLVATEDLDGIARAARFWLEQSAERREELAQRARAYVVANLSTEATLTRRLDRWRELLSAG